jgi:hypothetical protein
MSGNAMCEVAQPDPSPPSLSCPGRLSVGGPRQPTSWQVRSVPDADLLADDIVQEFLAMGADLDQVADVISRTRYLGAPKVRRLEPPETAPAQGGGRPADPSRRNPA